MKIERRDIVLVIVGLLVGILSTVAVWYSFKLTFDNDVTLALVGTVLGALLGLGIALAFYYLTKMDAEKATNRMLSGLDQANKDIVIKTIGEAVLKTSGLWAPSAAAAAAAIAARIKAKQTSQKPELPKANATATSRTDTSPNGSQP